jgi:hypothetical protein
MMGRWGELLFKGDYDLDEAFFISKDAGIELYYYEVDTEEPEHGGKGLEATRAHLNCGILNDLTTKYATTKSTNCFIDMKLRLVFLGKLLHTYPVLSNLKENLRILTDISQPICIQLCPGMTQ